MSTSPAITGKDLLRVLKSLGFEIVRIRGSHHFVQHPDGRATVVAVHSGETIGKGLLAKILRDVELSKEQLYDLL